MFSIFFFLSLRHPPISTVTDTLCPVTTLFRPRAFGKRLDGLADRGLRAGGGQHNQSTITARYGAGLAFGQHDAERAFRRLRTEVHTSELQSLMRHSNAGIWLNKKNIAIELLRNTSKA